MNLRCSFDIHLMTGELVFLIDRDQGMSMTNDAEAVCEWAHHQHPGKRVIYKDTEGNWCEMVHTRGVFDGFKHYDI